jgi:2-polyprenyl-6-methoxyphenol hydroxylase-like FAD-dependent oxidoreductase
MPADLEVAVVGGGIGGLTLAIALGARGVPVTVYEQAPEHREIGAGVALSANATRNLRRLGLGPELDAVSVEPSALVVRRWDDGRIVAAHTMGARYRAAFGAPYYGAHRVALQRVLAGALGPGVVEHDRQCVGVANDAHRGRPRITFADGGAAEADVVVGADGVHSTVRAAVAGPSEPVFSGTVGYRGLVPVAALPSLPDATPLQFWAGPRAHLLHYSIEGGTIVNFLAVVRQAAWTSEAWNEPCAVADAVAAYEGWHPAVTEMVGATREGSRWALHDHAPLARWSAGRVVLIGDAAHAMLPHQGQGANQTIEDAVLLAALLADAAPGGVEAALARYEAERRPRTRRVQRWSRLTADWMHLPDGPEAERRDARLQRAAADLEWIHGHDVLGRSEAAAAKTAAPGD